MSSDLGDIAIGLEATSEHTSKEHRTDLRALSVMVTSHAVQHLYVGGLALAYPLVVSEFHVSYGLLGAWLTAAGVVGGLLQGAAGLVRRSSARVVLGIQNIGLAVTTALAAVAPGFALFGVARFAGAVVSWPQHPVGSAYLSERFPRRRGAVLSWHTAGGSVGTVVAPLLASAVIAVAGWRWALATLAVPMGLGGVIVWWRLPAERRGGHSDRALAPEPPASALLSVLTRRRVAAILAASTIAAGGRGLGTISAYMPAYLKTDLHLSQLEVGGVFTAVMAASIVGPVVAGHLADRSGRHRFLVLAYLAGAASLVAFVGVGSHLWALVLVGLAVGVFAYAESPLIQAVFADAAGENVGRAAFGAFFAIAYGVGAIWLVILGWIIDAFGFKAAFVVMAGTFVAAAALVASAGPEPEPEPRPQLG